MLLLHPVWMLLVCPAHLMQKVVGRAVVEPRLMR